MSEKITGQEADAPTVPESSNVTSLETIANFVEKRKLEDSKKARNYSFAEIVHRNNNGFKYSTITEHKKEVHSVVKEQHFNDANTASDGKFVWRGCTGGCNDIQKATQEHVLVAERAVKAEASVSNFVRVGTWGW